MRALLVIALFARVASAATPLCLEVHDDAEAEGVRKLVEDELAHHPSHRVVTEDCSSRLVVELFTVGNVRYLTARVNHEVPVRFTVKTTRDIEERLTEALRQVLQHDPVYL